MIGTCLRNRYQIIGRIGQGGMGVVYLADDRRLVGRCVAVKMVHFNGTPTEEAKARLAQEAHVLARLDHPSLPRVSDFFVLDDEPGQPMTMVMDYVPGQDLGEIVKEARRKGRTLPESQVVAWAEVLCDTLTYLHLQEPPVLHRDIKPGNIKLSPDGTIKLVDFGIAFAVDVEDSTATVGTKGMGTLPYIPLEQYGLDLSGQDPRADIYSLGATLYHLLTGQQPLSAQERFLQPERFQPPSALVANLSPHVERAILRAMSLKREGRPASAAAFKEELLRGAPVADEDSEPETVLEAVRSNAGLLVVALAMTIAALMLTLQ